MMNKVWLVQATNEPKPKQLSIRLTAAQAAFLKAHANRNHTTKQDLVIAALAATIEGFPA